MQSGEKEIKDGFQSFYADSFEAWYNYLATKTAESRGVWLIIAKKDSPYPTLPISKAIDAALCHGWVDSKSNKRDKDTYYVYFAARNPKSNWSKVNKEKIARLDKEGLISENGYRLIEIAQRSGTWDALNEVDALIIPKDLEESFLLRPPSLERFRAYPPSYQRGLLEYLFNAKRQSTRKARIEKIVEGSLTNARII